MMVIDLMTIKRKRETQW